MAKWYTKTPNTMTMDDVQDWMIFNIKCDISAHLSRRSITFTADYDDHYCGSVSIAIPNKKAGRHILYLLGFKNIGYGTNRYIKR